MTVENTESRGDQDLISPSSLPPAEGDRKETLLERLIYWASLLLLFAAPFSIAVSQSALALTLLLGVALLAFKKRFLPRTGVGVFALAFVLWALICIPFSGEPTESLRHAKRFLLLPALWLFAGIGRTPQRQARMLAVLSLGAVGVALYGLIDYLQGPGGLAGRAMLTQGYMTAGGVMMICGLVITAFLATTRSAGMRLALGLVLLPILAALVATYTRSAWFGFGAGALLMLFLTRPKWAPVLVVLLVIAGFSAPGELRTRLFSSFDPGHVTNRQRVIMWKTGWQMMREHPLTGVGDRNLRELYRSYHEGEDVEVKKHLHSNYVMFGAIWGWPGLVLALAFLIAIFIRLFERWRRIRLDAKIERGPPVAEGWTLAALGVWLGFMVGGLFEWNFGDAEIALLVWSVAGLGLAEDATRGIDHEKR